MIIGFTYDSRVKKLRRTFASKFCVAFCVGAAMVTLPPPLSTRRQPFKKLYNRFVEHRLVYTFI